MDTWVLYGLVAAAFLGASGVVMKLASGSEHYNLSASAGAILVLLGAAAVFIPYYLFDNGFNLQIPQGNGAVILALGSGALWGIASIFMYRGFNLGAEASKIIPLVNTSALFAVVLGILLLHENPSHGETWKTVAGASLIVIGASMLG